MHNLGTVFNFEVVRTLKKKTFWISALSFPVIMGLVFAVIFFSNQATQDAVEAIEKQEFSIAIKDDSGLIAEPIKAALGAEQVDSLEAGVNKVENGEVDAFFYYPADLVKQKIEVHGQNVGIFNNSRYEAVAKALLTQSVSTSIDANVKAVLAGSVSMTSTTYDKGTVANPLMQMIVPGFFLILFYFLIAMFGNQALTSTTEEKENRVIEMILTTIEARTLIVGKILSLIVLAIIQAVIFVAPVLIAYVFLHDQLSIPSIDLNAIPFDWARIGAALVIFATSFMLFIGLLVAIGAATPTAKEAGNFLGIFMVMLFAPLYAVSLFISSPGSPIVQFMSYFPLTAPIPLLLRNAAGTITWPEIFLATAILVITTVLVVRIAVRVFRYGALEYSRKLGFKEILGRR